MVQWTPHVSRRKADCQHNNINCVDKGTTPSEIRLEDSSHIRLVMLDCLQGFLIKPLLASWSFMKCRTDNDNKYRYSCYTFYQDWKETSLSEESTLLTPPCAISSPQKGQIKNASEALLFSIFRMLNKNIDLWISRQLCRRCLPSLFG